MCLCVCMCVCMRASVCVSSYCVFRVVTWACHNAHNLCVCVDVGVYVCVFTYVHICMYACVRVCIHARHEHRTHLLLHNVRSLLTNQNNITSEPTAQLGTSCLFSFQNQNQRQQKIMTHTNPINTVCWSTSSISVC